MLLTIVALFPCIACLIIAGYLCINGLRGWGWFLLLAFLLSNMTLNVGSDHATMNSDTCLTVGNH